MTCDLRTRGPATTRDADDPERPSASLRSVRAAWASALPHQWLVSREQ